MASAGSWFNTLVCPMLGRKRILATVRVVLEHPDGRTRSSAFVPLSIIIASQAQCRIAMDQLVFADAESLGAGMSSARRRRQSAATNS